MKVRVDAWELGRALVDVRDLSPYAPAPTMASASQTAAPLPTFARAQNLPAANHAIEGATMDDFERFVADVRTRVDGLAAPWLDARMTEVRAQGADVEAAASAVRSLVLRGGKRMRAVLLAAAYEACSGQSASPAVAQVGVAIELLQAYLLIHDDWMDGDDLRRGGPSVPAMMRERFEGRRSEFVSVLAGDLASAWSTRALLDADVTPAALVRASWEFARMAEDVVKGQILDVAETARDAGAVEAMHALKTGSYTVRGPVVMGAVLAGAPDHVVAGLTAYAEPLGVAFQLRDDVLGVFGDPRTTGKSAGRDLRSGKRTAVVVEAMKDARARPIVERVLGRPEASDGDVAAAIEHLAASGVRARIEERIAVKVSVARAALAGVPLAAGGRRLLDSATGALTERDH
jgi:geranylgeranyl diphosphate synthase, type I